MTQPTETPSPLLDSQSWNALLRAHVAYKAAVSPNYDDVLNEVAGRIKDSGSIGKSDIGALVLWKRLKADTPWASKLMVMPERDVRTATASAVIAVNNTAVITPQAASDGRRALASLPGFKTGDALASALLLAAAPQRMAVYDKRAQKALKKLGLKLTAKPGRYRRYMELIEGLRVTAKHHNQDWTARDVDVALYWLGGPQQAQQTDTAVPAEAVEATI
ncbi:hypothetical protein M1D51_12540 [Arthrobacter sp. R3-55]